MSGLGRGSTHLGQCSGMSPGARVVKRLIADYLGHYLNGTLTGPATLR
jgi:hypothetical protein